MDALPALCPYLNLRDDRCANRLTLTRLREAFRLCVGNHEACGTYHQIRLAELDRDRRRRIAQPA